MSQPDHAPNGWSRNLPETGAGSETFALRAAELIDADGHSLDSRRPSAETGLHLQIYRRSPARRARRSGTSTPYSPDQSFPAQAGCEATRHYPPAAKISAHPRLTGFTPGCHICYILVRGNQNNELIMLGFGHQTVFSLCLALVTLTAVSVVSLALLFAERQDIDLLQEHIASLRQENSDLRAELEDYRSSQLASQETAVQTAD